MHTLHPLLHGFGGAAAAGIGLGAERGPAAVSPRVLDGLLVVYHRVVMVVDVAQVLVSLDALDVEDVAVGQRDLAVEDAVANRAEHVAPGRIFDNALVEMRIVDVTEVDVLAGVTSEDLEVIVKDGVIATKLQLETSPVTNKVELNHVVVAVDGAFVPHVLVVKVALVVAQRLELVHVVAQRAVDVLEA